MIAEYLKVFFSGAALCMIGQVLIDKTRLTPARILTLYVVAGVLLGAVGVPVHPARSAVIAGLQLCQRIVVVLLKQIAAVCICLVQVSHVFVIGGLRRLLFLPGQLFGPAGGCVLLCLHLGQQGGVMICRRRG